MFNFDQISLTVRAKKIYNLLSSKSKVKNSRSLIGPKL